MQIGHQLTLPQSTIATILHCDARQPDQPLQLSKLSSQQRKLNDQDKRIFICHKKRFLDNNLKAFGTPSKSNHTFSQPTI